MAAKFPEDYTRDVLCCMVCYSPFRSPRQLPCLHTFCEECLTKHYHIYRLQLSAVSGKVPCPTCREMITVPGNGVAGFRHDFKVMKFADILKDLDTEHGWTKACQICKLTDTTVEAEYFCNDCGKYLCETCFCVHQKIPVFVGHESTKLNAGRSSKILCKDHADQMEMLRYFCDDCEEGVCTLCTLTSHKTHNIVDINSGVSKQKSLLQNLLSVVNCRTQELEKTMKHLQGQQNSIRPDFERLRADIAEHARRRIEDINEEQKKLQADLVIREKKRTESLKEEIAEVSNYLKGLVEVDRKTMDLLSVDNVSVSRLLASCDELKKDISCIISLRSTSPTSGTAMNKLKFSPGMMILGTLEETVDRRPDNRNASGVIGQAGNLQSMEASESLSPRPLRRVSHMKQLHAP